MTISNELDMHDGTAFGNSGIRVVAGMSVTFDGNLSTDDAPQTTFTKSGLGELVFDPALPWLPAGQENAWGLKIDEGNVILRQLPEHDPGFSNWQTGPLVLRGTGTSLELDGATTLNATTFDNAGFRLLNAEAGSSTEIYIDGPTVMKIGGGNGSNQILGKIVKTGFGALWFGGDSLGSDAIGSRYDGRGDLDVCEGSVLFGGMPNTDDGSRAFPNDIVLRIQDQASIVKQQDQPGTVQSLHVNDFTGSGVAEMNLFTIGLGLGDGSLNVDLDQHGRFGIFDTLNKIGDAPLRFIAEPGAAISIAPGAKITINDGAVEVDGSRGLDPFTDTGGGGSLAVESNVVTGGLHVTAGTVSVDSLSGTGRTRVEAVPN